MSHPDVPSSIFAKRMRLVLSALFMMHMLQAGAQDIRDLFVSMPDSLLPTLTRNDRLDLIDFIDAGLDNDVANALRGRSRLTKLTPSVLKLKLTEHAELQMCRPKGTDIICLIHSVNAGGWDSIVKFYRPDWTPLRTSDYMSLPTLADFMPKTIDIDPHEYKNMENLAGISLIRADIVDDTTISFRFTSANEADHDYRAKVKPHIKEEVQRKIGAF